MSAADGAQLGSAVSRTLTLNLREQTHAAVLRDGFTFKVDLPAPSGARTLRVVIRDASSGSLGSLTIPLS